MPKSTTSLFLLLTGLTLTSGCQKNEPDTPPKSDPVAISGELRGIFIGPLPVLSTAATGNFSGSFDKTTNAMSYTVTFAGLSSPLTLAHLHPGAAGVKQPSFFTLPGLSSPISGKATLTPAQRELLLRGEVYVNLHTTNFQEFGELRAQLLLPNMVAVAGRFSGAQQVPTVRTAATGVVSGVFNKDTNELSYTVSYQGLTPVAGGFRIAPPDQANPAPTLTLPTLTSPLVAKATLTPAQREALLAGSFYASLHSQAFPDGEIRANLTVR